MCARFQVDRIGIGYADAAVVAVLALAGATAPVAAQRGELTQRVGVVERVEVTQQASARPGPVRVERFALDEVAPREPEVVGGSGGDGGSSAAVAGAALAAGVLGWFAGAYVGASIAHEPGGEGLDALAGATVGGIAVSVPASALAAHMASGRKGNFWLSMLAGYGVSAIAIAAWNDGGWLLGPALAIPIAIVIET